HGGVAVLNDGIEGGPELRHLRSGSQAATRARPGLAERRRFVGDRLEPSLTLRKTGRRNRLSFQLQVGHPLLAFGAAASYGTLGRLLVHGIFAALVCGNEWIGHHTIDQEVGLAPFEAGGAILGLLLVLRTNAGYERWWEGRKPWGGIINRCRHLAVLA